MMKTILTIFLTCVLFAESESRAIESAFKKSEESHKLSKRSVADAVLTHRNQKTKHELSRKSLLRNIMQNIDTSGEGSSRFDLFTPEYVRNEDGTWGITRRPGQGHKRGRKHRRNGGKLRRRHNKSRKSRKVKRSLVDSIATLLESDYKDEIMTAIKNVVQNDSSLTGKALGAEKLISEVAAARKCECGKSTTSPEHAR